MTRDFRPRNNDVNGNRPNHTNARPATGDFPYSNAAFLDQRMDRLEKMIQGLVQDHKRW